MSVDPKLVHPENTPPFGYKAFRCTRVDRHVEQIPRACYRDAIEPILYSDVIFSENDLTWFKNSNLLLWRTGLNHVSRNEAKFCTYSLLALASNGSFLTKWSMVNTFSRAGLDKQRLSKSGFSVTHLCPEIKFTNSILVRFEPSFSRIRIVLFRVYLDSGLYSIYCIYLKLVDDNDCIQVYSGIYSTYCTYLKLFDDNDCKRLFFL